MYLNENIKISIQEVHAFLFASWGKTEGNKYHL